MIKVLMVCLGNICRSPMAEMIMTHEIKKRGLEHRITVDSAATSNEEEGNPIYYAARQKLSEEGIEIHSHYARQIVKADGDRYDYILGMENRNINNINRILGFNCTAQVKRLLDYSENPRDISDPWYTGNFDLAYKDIYEGVNAFLGKIDLEK